MADPAFDLVVIGGGPAGYIAAIRAAQLGMATACIEKRERLGGTCLNVGCIPSKALLRSSELFEEAGHGLAQHGIEVSSPKLDLGRMQARKDKVVESLTDGIAFLFKKYKVTRIAGEARLEKGGKIRVKAADGTESRLSARNIVIATGSEVTPLPGLEIDEKRILSSTGALALPKVPKTMAVVGGGYIGLELGTVWRRLGTEVTVVEFLDRVTPGMDGEVSKQMQRILTKQGLKFRLGTKVTAAKTTKTGVSLTLEPAAGGAAETLAADVVLVSIGRRPYTAGLGLEEVGVALDAKGRIQTDADFRTNVAGIYAIGDVIAGPMLAHKAEHEGKVCVERIAGMKPRVNYDAIPGVVYTWPEAASVGKTEEELKAAGIAYRVGKFPFTANSRARANGTTEGQVKILADAANDKILGAHIVGADAGNLIHELVLAIEFGASSEDIAEICHAHPTLNESVMEAALNVLGHSLRI